MRRLRERRARRARFNVLENASEANTFYYLRGLPRRGGARGASRGTALRGLARRRRHARRSRRGRCATVFPAAPDYWFRASDRLTLPGVSLGVHSSMSRALNSGSRLSSGSGEAKSRCWFELANATPQARLLPRKKENSHGEGLLGGDVQVHLEPRRARGGTQLAGRRSGHWAASSWREASRRSAESGLRSTARRSSSNSTASPPPRNAAANDDPGYQERLRALQQEAPTATCGSSKACNHSQGILINRLPRA